MARTKARPDPTPLDVAAGMLRRAPMSEAELATKLVAKGYQPSTAAGVVARCCELGWLNDEVFAHDRARALRQRGAGSLKITADLEGRQLSGVLVQRAVSASLDGVPERTWAERALAASECAADSARAWRLLSSRGFPEDVVADLIDMGD